MPRPFVLAHCFVLESHPMAKFRITFRLALVFPLLLNLFCWPQDSASNMAEQTSPLPVQRIDPLLAKSQSLLEKGNVSDAEHSVRQYLEQHPMSADAHYLLGLILFKQVKPKESLGEYTEGAKYRDPSPYDLEIVALNYVLLADYTEADKWLAKSLTLQPKNWEGWYYLGRTKYNENRFAEAIRAFQECLKLSPENVKAEDNLGLSYAGLGQIDAAMAAYKQAIAWQAQLLIKNPGPYLDLGTLLREQNRDAEAIPYLVHAAEIAPQDSKVHQELGKGYEHQNQLAKAQVELEKAAALTPDDAALHFVLGKIYRKQGMIEKAKAEFDRSETLRGTRALRDAVR
jgi:tetratricopeptide (TPR) repeat protein